MSAARGKVAVHDDVLYCQKASLVHSPCHLMSIWAEPCLYATMDPLCVSCGGSMGSNHPRGGGGGRPGLGTVTVLQLPWRK